MPIYIKGDVEMVTIFVLAAVGAVISAWIAKKNSCLGPVWIAGFFGASLGGVLGIMVCGLAVDRLPKKVVEYETERVELDSLPGTQGKIFLIQYGPATQKKFLCRLQNQEARTCYENSEVKVIQERRKNAYRARVFEQTSVSVSSMWIPRFMKINRKVLYEAYHVPIGSVITDK